ncbi:sulfotransferase 1A1-like isoform X2 [Palaemon carinicauda]
MTWPKCGTTLMQETIWTLINNPNLNSPDGQLSLTLRSPFFEMDMFAPPSKPGEVPAQNKHMLAAMKRWYPDLAQNDAVFYQFSTVYPDPRLLKTHLPFSLMSPSILDSSKVVYVARNPKDVVVSYHHHSKIVKGHDFVGRFEDFVQYFVDDDLMYGPYWLHLKEALERRNHPNLHFMFYEDMKANPLEELKKLNEFLSTNLSEDQLKGIAKYTSFKEMKARGVTPILDFEKNGVKMNVLNEDIVKKDGGILRKGETGDWKNKLSLELEAKIDQWIQKNLADLDVTFKYRV